MQTNQRLPRDLIAIAILVVACLVLRLPSLDRAVLNPDESQYEATASYLLATGASTFAFPYGTPGTFALYKTMARIFGPYSMFEMRSLVLLLCLGMAILLYAWVSHETDRWSGLAGGLVFLHYNIRFEGLSANREWFAGAAMLLGLSLFRTGRSRSILVASGAVCGAAVWFKLQAVPLLLVVPLALLLRALHRRSLRGIGRDLPPYVLGGMLAGALFLLPFWLAGTAADYLGSIFGDWTVFVRGSEKAVEATVDWSRVFYTGLPDRALLLVAYLFTAVVFAEAARSSAASERGRDAAWIFGVYVVAAAVCVQMGHRFFGHYYQFMVPPVAALVGFALHRLRSTRETPPRLLALVGLALGVYALDRVLGAQALLRSPAAWIYLPGLLIVCGIAWRSRGRRLTTLAAALLALEIVMMCVRVQLLPTPASMWFERRSYTTLTRELLERSAPGDRLFVWGWTPEVYSLTRLESASHITIAQYIVSDYQGRRGEPTIDRDLETVLMRDLHARKPRFIVDCAARSRFKSRPGVYRLEQYPDFGLVTLLREAYEKQLHADGCDLYVRSRAPARRR